MPTYEYICRACDHKWEEFQSITAKPTRKCPVCGKRKAERLISGGGGLIFKGAGFYVTDYRSKSYKEGEKREQSKAKSDTAQSKSSATPSKDASSSSSSSSSSSTD